MGDVVVQQFASVDGFGADVDGDTGALFASLEGSSREFDEANAQWLESVGAVVLGARTYRESVAYWPTPAAAGELVAARINALPKVVLSGTLAAAPWGEYAPATVVAGDAAAHVRDLAARTDGDVVVWGSFDVTAQLLRADAVDLLRVVVVPVLLGDGVRHVPRDLPRRALALRGSAVLDGGVVELTYGRASA